MSIPISFLTAVLKKDLLDSSYPGGVPGFMNEHPDCAEDEQLIGVSFMSGDDLQTFTDVLTSVGFDHVNGGAVGEMFHGAWKPCDGIEFVVVGMNGPFRQWEARSVDSPQVVT